MYKVLIVDDEERVRKGLEKIIDWKSLGFSECTCAENGRIGIAKALEFMPDLIIADLKMPGISGIQMIRHLRDTGVQCQFIILSGAADFEDAKDAIDLRVATYLLKPINKEVLTQKIAQLFPLIDDGILLDLTAQDVMNEILDYINANYNKTIKLATLADEFHYSISHLARVFKNVTGGTLHDYLEKIRMERAKEFLQRGHKVYVAARMVGYSNVDYFSDKFKAYTGKSPNSYKKSHD